MRYRYRSYPLATEWYDVSESVVVGNRWVSIEVTDEEGLVVVWDPYNDGYFLKGVRIKDREINLVIHDDVLLEYKHKAIIVEEVNMDKALPAIFKNFL